MKLLFRQRFFSWLDSYDIYNEQGETEFTVQGKLSLGHCLEIYDRNQNHRGTVKEEILTFLPRFAFYVNGSYTGQLKKELTFFKPVFHLDCNGWHIQGNLMEWDYQVTDSAGRLIMQASKQIFNLTDTYILDIADPKDALFCLMIVLAIDAAKCSSSS